MTQARHRGEHSDEYRAYMAALIEGDVRGLSAVIDRLQRGHMPWNRICSDFVQRGLYDVGHMWECNEIPVSVEHLAASATQVILSERFMKHRRPEYALEAVIACVPNELHDIGTLIIADVCEAAGWRAVLLGSNTPARDLLRFLGQRTRLPDLLALSITLPANRPALQDALTAITDRYPDLRIVVGGQALDGPAEAITFRKSLLACYPSVRHVSTLDALERALTRPSELELAQFG